MRISHRYRFIFFAFPKTGSTSVRSILTPLSDIVGRDVHHVSRDPNGSWSIPAHISPPELASVFGEIGRYDDYFRFVCVRNPWTRLVSAYRMARVQHPEYREPFDRWLLDVRPQGRGGGQEGAGFIPRWERFGTYALDSFVCDASGRRLVDHVYRMEDLALVAEDLRARGIPVSGQIGHENSKKPLDVDSFYTPATRSVVAMRYAKEIAEFGYTYPG